MNATSASQNRRSHRSNLWMAAEIAHDFGVTPVVLRNLSAEGAQIEGDLTLIAGDAVSLRKKDLVAVGRIVWIEGRRAGILFCANLNPDVVLRHVPVPQPTVEQCYKRPGFRGKQIEQERRIGETDRDRSLSNSVR